MFCMQKDIVYQIKCKECAGPYVGEAEHLMETRLEEHNGEARRQARTRPRVITTAPSIPMPPSYADKVHYQLLQWSLGRQIGRVEKDTREAIEIRNTQPPVNTRTGWDLLS
eukprot:scpid101485/ scgid0845/ 